MDARLDDAAALSLLDRAHPRLHKRPPRGSGKRVLVAEDEVSVRDFVLRGLTLAGYQASAVGDGVGALEALAAASSAPYDLLLTDIVMPRLDGIALALKVAQDYPNLPVLMMTGYAAERQRAHNLDVLIHDVLPKPFSLEQVLDAVARALAVHA